MAGSIKGINSYIVGCKWQTVLCFRNPERWINSYIVGCKYQEKVVRHDSFWELIVT